MSPVMETLTVFAESFFTPVLLAGDSWIMATLSALLIGALAGGAGIALIAQRAERQRRHEYRVLARRRELDAARAPRAPRPRSPHRGVPRRGHWHASVVVGDQARVLHHVTCCAHRADALVRELGDQAPEEAHQLRRHLQGLRGLVAAGVPVDRGLERVVRLTVGSERGMSFIELLVVLALVAGTMAASLALLHSGTKAYGISSAKLERTQDARAVLEQIAKVTRSGARVTLAQPSVYEVLDAAEVVTRFEDPALHFEYQGANGETAEALATSPSLVRGVTVRMHGMTTSASLRAVGAPPLNAPRDWYGGVDCDPPGGWNMCRGPVGGGQ